MTLADVGQNRGPEPFEERLARFVVDLIAYGLVSLAALVCDYGLLLGLTACGMYYLVASFVSFSAGMIVAYALCVRCVFASRRGDSRGTEAAGFFAVGAAGLLLTQVLLYVFVSRIGLSVAAAKIPTTGIVFLFNFLCRRGLVFVDRAAAL